MQMTIERANRFVATPLDLRSRGLLVAAALLLVSTFFVPLWNMTMFAPQYPDGLRMNIYSYKLDGGNGGQDVKEINVLNHYIGMRDLAVEDFDEFKWMPFAIGGLGLLFLRAAVLGTAGTLVDVTVLYAYFAAFALGSFAYKMYSYGHTLSPSAAVRVAPFTPPIVGFKQLANFEVYSYPAAAAYALGLVALVLLAALVLVARSGRREPERAGP